MEEFGRNVITLTVLPDGTRKVDRPYTNYGGNAGALFLRLDGPVYSLTNAPKGSDGDGDLTMLRWHLQERGVVDWEHGLTDQQAAEVFEGPEPAATGVDAARTWRTAMSKRRKLLRNRRRYEAWRRLGDEQCPTGGTALVWKWFAAPEE